MPLPSLTEAIDALNGTGAAGTDTTITLTLRDQREPRAAGAAAAPPSDGSGVVPASVPSLFAEDDGLDALDDGLTESAYDFPFGPPHNRGATELLAGPEVVRELQFSERVALLHRSHLAWERNPWCKGAIRLMRGFAVRQGHSMTYRSAEAKQVLDAVRADPLNAVERADKQLCEQLLVDGELFIRLTAASGTVQGTPVSKRLLFDSIPPWWVEDMVLNDQFRRQVTAYRVRFRTGALYSNSEARQELDDVPAGDVVHVAINQLAYELRGRPETLAVLPWLKAYKDWLEDRARQNRYKGAFLFDVTVKNQAAGTVAAKRQQYQRTPAPASIVVHGENEEWKTVDPKIAANDASEDGRQIKLATAVGFNLPEYMLGDGENANKATANAQQLPALITFEDLQDVLANQVWRPIYRRALQLAIEAGTLNVQPDTDGRILVPEIDADGEPIVDRVTGAPKLVELFDSFDVRYPALEQQDPKSLSEALQVQLHERLVDRQTAMQTLGYDPQQIAKRLAADDAEDMERAAAGMIANDDDERDTLGRPASGSARSKNDDDQDEREDDDA